MNYPGVFAAFASHSGDSYFRYSHPPAFVQTQRTLEKHQWNLARFVEYFEGANKRSQGEYQTMEMLGYAAAYSPRSARAFDLDLPFDRKTGALRDDVFARWLTFDPAEVCLSKRAELARLRLRYLDCGRRGEYALDVGARVLADRMREMGLEVRHEEFDDDHRNVGYRYDIAAGAVRRIGESMTRFVLAAVFCAFVLGSMPAGAQETPTPAPANPNTTAYNDPAMSFTAAPGFRYLGGRPYDPLSSEPTVVAAFVSNPGEQDAHFVQIQIEFCEGGLSGYETLATDELRGHLNNALVSKKQQTTLSNGMPALWEEISIGEGFQEMKRWQYEWVDGQRGVILSDSGRYGGITEEQAKAELANVSAVDYPRNRI